MKRALILILLSTVIINSFSQNIKKLFPVSNGTKWGLADRKKQMVTDYVYDYIYPFREGYCVVKAENKCGLLSYKGVETIKPSFDKLTDLNKGYAIATNGDSCTVVDSLGKFITNQWFDKIYNLNGDIFRAEKKFSKGMARIRKTIKAYNLEKVIGLDRDSVCFGDNFIGYISVRDTKFKGLWFSGGEDFMNGKAKIAISKHTYYLDTIGNITARKADDCDLSLMNVFIPDEYPEYPGGQEALKNLSDKYLNNIISQNITFKTLELAVIFIIDKTGRVVSPRMEDAVDPIFDNAIISMVNNMEKWKPAKYEEKPVCYQIRYPIKFHMTQH